MQELGRLPVFLISMALVTLAAFALRAVSALPFWGCFAIAVIALLLNGWLATWEDEQPGGFNNPKK